MLKSKLRKKILKIREKNNKKNIQIDFNQIIKIFKEEKITKKIIGGYYPVNFEVDDLELLKKLEEDKFSISLPVIKKNVEQKKNELKDLSDKFRELKSLVYDYRDKKEEEMKRLSQDHEDFKKEIEKNKENYEKIIEETTDEIESFVKKANLENKVQ